MSKSPKPRHFSDSSRERWDKNRHEQRTKSYLKRKKKKKRKRSEEKFRDVCARVCVCVMSRKRRGATEKTCVHVKWWGGGSAGLQPVCLRKEIPSLAFVCTATESASGAADTMTTSVLQERPSYSSSPPLFSHD